MVSAKLFLIVFLVVAAGSSPAWAQGAGGEFENAARGASEGTGAGAQGAGGGAS
uniref:Uncharacterized protein n=1 Tax=Arundo donax TaxID=35708 RepID=A0A0A8Z270_ARUDO